MNTIDVFDFELAKPRTPQPPPPPSSDSELSTSDSANSGPHEPTLNEEVNEALGQLSRFWGGFRKQSQSAFEAARKDLGSVVNQARSEFGKMTAEVSSPTSPTIADVTMDPASPARDVKGKEREKAPDVALANEQPEEEHPQTSPPLSPLSSGFFSRIQAQLPPNLQPAAISSAISSARSHSSLPSVDFNQLKSSITTNIQRAQTNVNFGEAEKLAESYLSKLKASTEAFTKDAGEFFREAVRFVPPDGTEGVHEMSVVSGTDVWVFPSPIGTPGWGAGKTHKSEGSGTPGGSLSMLTPSRSLDGRGGATRSEALLRRLKYDPELLRLDPAQDEDISSLFEAFVRDDIDKNGGIEGDAYLDKISILLAPGLDGQLDADAKALIDTRDVLVPSELSNGEFWKRYFFRVHQVTEEEVKRKAVLADAAQREELFSWEEDEEEEQTAPTPPAVKPKPAAITVEVATMPLPQVSSNPAISSLATSRRTSEDSYDVIEAGTRLQSPAQHSSKLSEELVARALTAKAGDDSDSDWE